MTSNSLPNDRAVLAVINSGKFRLPLSHGVSLHIVAQLNGFRTWNAVVASDAPTDVLKSQAVALRRSINAMTIPINEQQAALITATMALGASKADSHNQHAGLSGPAAKAIGDQDSGGDEMTDLTIYPPDELRDECQPIFDSIIETIRSEEAAFLAEAAKLEERQRRGLRGLWESAVMESVLEQLLCRFFLREEADEVLKKRAANWAAVIGDYERYAAFGEHIYHIQEKIARNLIETPLGAVTIDDVRLPKASLYIHFGDTTGVELRPPEEEEEAGDIVGRPVKYRFVGAYISNVNLAARNRRDIARTDGLSIVLVAQSEFNSSREDAPTLEGGISYLLMHPAYHTIISFDESRRFDEAIRSEQIGSRQDRDGSEASWDYSAWPDDVLDKAMGLVAKALIYITRNPSAVEDTYELGAPVDLVRKSKSKSSKNTARRSAAELRNLGYRKVKFVGPRELN